MTEQVNEEDDRKRLLDNLPCGAGVYELRDGVISLTYQNKRYRELVGLNTEEYPDLSPMSAIYPGDVEVIMSKLTQAIEQKCDIGCNIRLKHQTLGYRPVYLAGHVVADGTGAFLIYATFTLQNGISD